MLGERDRAVRLLDEAVEQGLAFPFDAHHDFALASLRGYAPFEEFLRPKG